MRPLKPGQNPRQALARHAERGPVEFRYHLPELAEVTGLKVSTLKDHPILRYARSRDLRSVALFAVSRLLPRLRPLTAAEAFEDERETAQWGGRWPLLQVYGCPVPGCASLALGGPLCFAHGSRGWRFSSGSGAPFELWLGDRWVAFHRWMLDEPRGFDVVHRDGNPWNNRPGNLEAVKSRPTFSGAKPAAACSPCFGTGRSAGGAACGICRGSGTAP